MEPIGAAASMKAQGAIAIRASSGPQEDSTLSAIFQDSIIFQYAVGP